MNPLVGLDLGANRCDLSCVFAVESYFVLKLFYFKAYRYDFFVQGLDIDSYVPNMIIKSLE